MTRVLSELLEAREPAFSQGLRQLERLAGHPQADIRLSSQLATGLRHTLHELGLDAADTTGRELYAAQADRLSRDEGLLRTELLRGSRLATEDVVEQVAIVVRQKIAPAGACFGLKLSVAKSLLRANPPKRLMKLLGYRSADSMIKQETTANLLAAANLVESKLWQRRLLTSYAKLRPADFETRQLAVLHPASPRWQKLADSLVAMDKEYVLPLHELASVVLLPLPSSQPLPLPGLTTTILALQAVNEVRACGSFLKLHQMQAGFGGLVQQVAGGEPVLPLETLDRVVSWFGLQQYFGRQAGRAVAMFEPLLTAEELAWKAVEETLAEIAPAFAFWKDSAYLALQHAGQVVSCNLFDAVLSHCNQLPYEQRLTAHFRHCLQNELLLNYLKHDKLETAVLGSLRGRLVPEMVPVLAED